MKKLCLTSVIAVFLLFLSARIQGQTTQTQLDQLKLMQQFVGTWQMNQGKDTSMVAEIQQYGKAFIETDYRVIKDNKSFLSIWSYSFSAKEGKFKIFALMQNGNYSTWIASFVTEKKWIQEQVQNFSPENVQSKVDIVFVTPSNMTATFFNSGGIKTGEEKFTKIK